MKGIKDKLYEDVRIDQKIGAHKKLYFHLVRSRNNFRIK